MKRISKHSLLKPVSLLVATLLMSTMFAGCGNTVNSSTPSAASQNTSSNGKTVIRIMSAGRGYWEKNLDPYIKKYNESQNKVTVSVDYFSRGDLLTSIEAKLGSGDTQYDAVTVDAPLVAPYSYRKYLEPLDAYYTKDEISQYTDALANASEYNGKFMAAPMNSSAQLLWYNLDYLQQAGYKALSKDPNARVSWEQLAEMAKKVKAKVDPTGSKGVSGIGFEQVGLVYQMLQLPNSMGASSLGKDGFTVKGVLDSQGWLSALDFYQKLYKNGISARGLTANDVASNFTGGKIAFMIGGTWTSGSASGASLHYGYTYSPYFDGHKDAVATPTDSWHLGINVNSKNKSAAADFIKYITLGNGEQWNRNAGNVPSTKAGLKEVQNGKYGEVMSMAAYEAQHTACPRPVTAGFSEYETAVNALFEDVRNGADVKTSVQTTISQLGTAFKKYQK